MPGSRFIASLVCLALTTGLRSGPPIAVAAERVPDTSNPTSAIRQAEAEAEARHTRALRECAAAADYASCTRDADAELHTMKRRLAGDRQRATTAPGAAPQDASCVQGERLIRDLEQAAPRPPPGRPADPGSAAPSP